MPYERVRLNSPVGSLIRFGQDAKAFLEVENGAVGFVVREGRSGSRVIEFDGLQGVHVEVPEHWLAVP